MGEMNKQFKVSNFIREKEEFLDAKLKQIQNKIWSKEIQKEID
jgi:hypothetical protein